MATTRIEDWKSLTAEERAFVARVEKWGGNKHGAEPFHPADDKQPALWVNPEKLNFIRAIGSYKFVVMHGYFQVQEDAFKALTDD